MRKLALTLVLTGVVLGVAAEWSTYLPGSADRAAGDFAVGLTFTLGGALVLERSRPVAALLAATGLAWFLGGLVGALVFLYRGPLVHLLLSYPRGRLESHFERSVVVAAYVVALVHPLGRSNAVTLGFACLVFAASLTRHAHASGAERRARATALASTAAVASVLAGAALARLLDAGTDSALLWTYEVVLTLVAVALCAELLWGGWARAAATGVVVDLGDMGREATLRVRLARSVGDPSLELGYWRPALGSYVDEAGQSVEARPPPSGRSVLIVRDEERAPMAAILHDPAVLDAPVLAEAVTAAVRIAVANVELRAQIQAKVEEVRASRRRLVEAAGAERRRLERELREAAEPRLRAIAGLLQEPGPELEELLRGLDAVHAELSELARGIHPRALTESGLAAALEELARRSPFPVEVEVTAERPPPTVAAAAYFLCSEGLANAAKHARASRVRLAARAVDGTLVVEVSDDGTGGADIARGSGLRGLLDRVEALGGELHLQTPDGAGTRLQAVIPITGETVAGVPLEVGPRG